MDAALNGGLAAWAGGAALLSLVPALARAASAPPVARFEHFRYVGSQPVYAKVKAGSGQYLNPIVEGFYPDPSITRVGRDYYLATSSFAYFPGIPIFHSRDLVHWSRIGSAISRPEQIDFKDADVSGGLYAPDLKFRDGRFYLFNTCLGCGGNYVVTATDAAGPWSDPVWLPFAGIDPSIFFDDDGRAYVLNNGPPEGPPLYDGHRAIWLQQIDLSTLKMVGPRTVLVNGGVDLAKRPSWIEGPHLFKRGGHYYLIAAEGGTGDQHSEVVFRATSVRGPFLPGPANPILTQRDLDPARADPVTSTGHADIVTTPDGRDWAVFLGVRPYGPDLYNTGRETFLLPVSWQDGWPHITAPGQSVPYAATRPDLPPSPAVGWPTSGDFTLMDDFIGPTLAAGWTQLRTPRQRWWSVGGGLSLQARADTLGGKGQPSFMALRQSHRDATVTVAVSFDPRRAGNRAGLAAFQDERRYFLIAVEGDGAGGRAVRLERRSGKADPQEGTVLASAPLPGRSSGPVRLRIEASGRRYTFGYAPGGGAWRNLGGVQDGAILSTHVAGGFTGVMLGMYAHAAP